MKKKPITIHLTADTSELDEVQEKLDELHIALTRANILMEEGVRPAEIGGSYT